MCRCWSFDSFRMAISVVASLLLRLEHVSLLPSLIIFYQDYWTGFCWQQRWRLKTARICWNNIYISVVCVLHSWFVNSHCSSSADVWLPWLQLVWIMCSLTTGNDVTPVSHWLLLEAKVYLMNAWTSLHISANVQRKRCQLLCRYMFFILPIKSQSVKIKKFHQIDICSDIKTHHDYRVGVDKMFKVRV